MYIKKLIGAVSAVSVMALSMSAVCVYAEDEPQLDDWTLTETYKMSLDELSNNEDVRDKLGESWSFARASGSTSTSDFIYRADNDVVAFSYNRLMTYTNSEESQPFYYRYKVRVFDDNGVITLNGLNNGQIVSGSSINGSAGATYEFTTVVDPENKVSYTYNYNKEIIGIINIDNDATVSGIVFARNGDVDKAFWIYDFSYGTASLETTEPEPDPEPENTQTKAYTFVQTLEEAKSKNLVVTITPAGGEAQTQSKKIEELMSTHLEGKGNLSLAVILTNIPEGATVDSVVIE